MQTNPKPRRFVIEAGRLERQYWQDLWSYRELFGMLAWRDFLLRYKQTAVGVVWALLRPLLLTLVLTLAGTVGRLPSGGVPYPLFVMSALLPWQFFATALAESGNCLVNHANLVTKIYFPRIIMPASSVLVSFVDLLIAGLFWGLLAVYYRFLPPWHLLWLPAFGLLLFAAALGAGFWVAALMVKYRDFRFIVPFLVQFGLYAAPVLTMTSQVPDRWRFWYALNPMVGIIDGFRWCLLGAGNNLYAPALGLAVAGCGGLLLSGFWCFRRMEQTFADTI